jgi:hypothetical protein
VSEIPLIETAQQLRDLSARWKALNASLDPGRTGERTHNHIPGPKLPLRVDVLDTILQIRLDALRWVANLRSIRAKGQLSPNTESSLIWLADQLASWPQDNRTDLIEEICDQTAKHSTQVKILLGIEQRPVTARLRCPYCGRNLTIKPDQGFILCRNHDCRCAAEDCACVRGKGHGWPESDWPRLGLILDTQNAKSE